MSMMFENTVPQFKRNLVNLQKFLDKAMAHATAKKFEVDTLCTTRLAPDMLPFVSQIQMACDGAKSTCARLAGKEPPKHEDNEKTFAELKARVTKCLDYVNTFKPTDFNGCEDRRVVLPWMPGKWMQAGDYVNQMALPNFYFHMTTAYALLRHNGVDLGKMDFIGDANIKS